MLSRLWIHEPAVQRVDCGLHVGVTSMQTTLRDVELGHQKSEHRGRSQSEPWDAPVWRD